MTTKPTQAKTKTPTVTTKVTPVKKSQPPVAKKPIIAKKPEPVKKTNSVAKPKLQEKTVFTKVNPATSTVRPQTDRYISGVVTFSELMTKMTQNLSGVK